MSEEKDKAEQPRPLRYPADWLARRKADRPISVITAYDAGMARLVAASRVDAILIGDSLAMVVQGRRSTLPVTLDEMIYHARMVRRGAPETFLIGDLSFGSYQISPERGIESAVRMMKEAEVDAVKLEGARPDTLGIVEQLVHAGVPVMGHIGLTPQSYLNLGGFRVQGREDGNDLVSQARALQASGCFAVVLELVVAEVAEEITNALQIPTIGIGSGVKCSGQVLVINDMLGFETEFHPRHLKRYAELGPLITRSLNTYHEEVRERKFPGPEHEFRRKK